MSAADMGLGGTAIPQDQSFDVVRQNQSRIYSPDQISKIATNEASRGISATTLPDIQKGQKGDASARARAIAAGVDPKMFQHKTGMLGRFDSEVLSPVVEVGVKAGIGAGLAGIAGYGPAAGGGSSASVAPDYTSPSWQAANSSQVPGFGASATGVTPSMTSVPGITSDILGAGAAAPSSILSGAESPWINSLAGGSPVGPSPSGPAGTGVAGSPPASVAPPGTGLPPSYVGSSAQLPSGGGPLGDVATGVGDTTTDYNAASKALTEPPSSASSVIKSTLGDVGKFAQKYGLPIAALSTQLLRKPGIPQEGQLSDQSQQNRDRGNADIDKARSGQLTDSQKAQITKFKSDTDTQIKQYMVNSGQGVDSTAYVEMKAKMETTALAMQQGFSDQLFAQGMAELGMADTEQAQLIQIRLQREKETGDAFNQFMWTLGMMGHFGG